MAKIRFAPDTPPAPPPAPTIQSISPGTGSSAGGTAITITGKGFIKGAVVTVGNAPATAIDLVNSMTIIATTGARAAGFADVVVTNPDYQRSPLIARRSELILVCLLLRIGDRTHKQHRSCFVVADCAEKGRLTINSVLDITLEYARPLVLSPRRSSDASADGGVPVRAFRPVEANRTWSAGDLGRFLSA